MKRVILGSLLAFQGLDAGVVGKPEESQILTNIDTDLGNVHKRAFTSPAAAFARSYGHYNFNKRSWGGSKNKADYASVMKSTIEQLKNNLRLLESKTKGLPDQYVAGLISRLGETSRRTMSKLCRSGEVESRLCSLIESGSYHDHDILDYKKRGASVYNSNLRLPGQFVLKRATGFGHHLPLTDDEALFMKRAGFENYGNLFKTMYEPEEGYIPDDMVYQPHQEMKRDGRMANSEHQLPQFMNYNTFPAGDSINWGSLPGFGAKSAFNMPSKRSTDYANKADGEDYSQFLGSLLAKYVPKTGSSTERSLL